MSSKWRKFGRHMAASAQRLLMTAATVSFALDAPLQAESGEATTRAPEVLIEATSEYEESRDQPFLQPVEGTRINSGKKSAVINLNEPPKIVNHNYRQALAMTPGLVLAEDPTPLLSIGYRGLNPYRTQFTQVLKDGIPITMDMFGYPEAYYTPPLEAIERIEFLHGGAALMYGPQPGGSLNYLTYNPRTDRELATRSQHVFGSDNLYSTYDALTGTADRFGYYTYFYHRETDGFRQANSDQDLFSGSMKVVMDGDTDSRWIFSGDGYSEEHGEAGGQTLSTNPNGSDPNAVLYDVDRDATSRFNDRFRLQRGFTGLAWEKDFSEDTELRVQNWGKYYHRLSRRQLGGGFGTLPSGPAAEHNQIQVQKFYNEATESRLRHDWSWGETSNTFAGGLTFYHTDSPITNKIGATPNATNGPVQNKTVREIYYTPIFAENLFRYGHWSITPGVRFENLWQNIDEKVNVAKTAVGEPLAHEDQYNFVPLLGLGVEYELRPNVAAYGNVSQSYRPKLFTEEVPTEPLVIVSGDLKEGQSWQYEVGWRGNPAPYLNWDTSLFLIDFSDQIGAVSVPGPLPGQMLVSIENVGRAIHKGAEVAAQLDIVAAQDALRGTDYAQRWGGLTLYANAMFLNAEFVSGPQDGKTPQYAPDYLVRAGAIYHWQDRAKVALGGTYVDNEYGDDNNSQPFFIPSYGVCDLTMEAEVHDHVTVFAGINNLLDQAYYARIRAEGIDPAYERNFYGGVSLTF